LASNGDFEKTRRFALAQIKRVLGMAEPTTDRLFAKARTVLGQDRANQILELARLARLSDRWMSVSALAALVAGTQALGPEWWTRPHEALTPTRTWETLGIPEALLAAGHGDLATEDGGSCLALLGLWIADDAADNDWGRPTDRIDMNDPRSVGVVAAPAAASAGDRFTVGFAPGARVWVDVVDLDADAEGAVGEARGAGGAVGAGGASGRPRLASRLAERKYHDVALVQSAWSIATATGPIRLPGEMAGRSSDPFAAHLDHDASRRLFQWAVANGENARELAGPWRTKDALWTARLRLGLPYSRPGAWLMFDDAVVAAIDGNDAAVMNALATLGA
jgi:hypothetical protein